MIGKSPSLYEAIDARPNANLGRSRCALREVEAHGEDDLADVDALLHQRMGLRGLIQRKHGMHRGIREMGRTRGSGRVNFGNPAEADLSIIVNGNYTYILVDEEVVGEYTLSQSQLVRGRLALTVLSGTNKDYGTRCEMTNIHLFIPE